MSNHLSLTTGCNLGCEYCYEDTDRERKQEWVDRQYDMEKVMDRLAKWKETMPDTTPSLHGGEPLLVRKEDLEQLWSYIDENWDGNSSIQTNGTLIDDDHIEMFKEYNISVGISCDGPEELNRLRKASGERESDAVDTTDRMTYNTHEAIERCAEEGVVVNVITVLHEENAGTEEKYERLLDWMDELCEMGVGGHFNPAIPYEDIQEDVSLDGSTLKDRYLRLWEWMKEEPYRSWGPANLYVDNLLGNYLRNCVNNKCDVANAGAAKIAMGNGETTGCGKTWAAYGDGGTFLQGSSTGNEYDSSEERYDMLKTTPGAHTEGEPDMGGCKGCKFWNVCQGGCPSAGMNDDYRNRTVWCEAKYGLYEKVEEDLKAIMPNIRLITDLPWNAEVSDLSQSWSLDIKPFAAMRPDTEGKSTAHMGSDHQYGTVEDAVPDETMDHLSKEELVEHWEDKVGEENVYVDEDGAIHAGERLDIDRLKEGEAEEEAPDPEGWQEV